LAQRSRANHVEEEDGHLLEALRGFGRKREGPQLGQPCPKPGDGGIDDRITQHAPLPLQRRDASLESLLLIVHGQAAYQLRNQYAWKQRLRRGSTRPAPSLCEALGKRVGGTTITSAMSRTGTVAGVHPIRHRALSKYLVLQLTHAASARGTSFLVLRTSGKCSNLDLRTSPSRELVRLTRPHLGIASPRTLGITLATPEFVAYAASASGNPARHSAAALWACRCSGFGRACCAAL